MNKAEYIFTKVAIFDTPEKYIEFLERAAGKIRQGTQKFKAAKTEEEASQAWDEGNAYLRKLYDVNSNVTKHKDYHVHFGEGELGSAIKEYGKATEKMDEQIHENYVRFQRKEKANKMKGTSGVSEGSTDKAEVIMDKLVSTKSKQNEISTPENLELHTSAPKKGNGSKWGTLAAGGIGLGIGSAAGYTLSNQEAKKEKK